MSYEGFSQFWCKNSHYWTLDCNIVEDLQKNLCPICKKPAVFENMVDITNGSFDDEGNRIDGFIELELIEEHKAICETCGKEHICNCSKYEIPTKKDLR